MFFVALLFSISRLDLKSKVTFGSGVIQVFLFFHFGCVYNQELFIEETLSS